MKIYVISHKKIDLPVVSDIYEPLQVGTELHGRIGGKWSYDNEGDNISEKNLSYNELTGLYWIWKNSKENIVGLCHYRRYFVTPAGKLQNLFRGTKTHFLEETDIKRMLKNCDMIVHNKTFFKEGCGKQFTNTQKHPEDLELTKNVVKERYPEYVESFNQVFSGKTCHLLNVVIAEKKLLDNYCEWLFDVLAEIEKRLVNQGETDFSRRMGMIGERLLDVWIVHNNIKIRECFMINTERNDWKPW